MRAVAVSPRAYRERAGCREARAGDVAQSGIERQMHARLAAVVAADQFDARAARDFVHAVRPYEHARAGRVDIDVVEVDDVGDAVAVGEIVDDKGAVDGQCTELIDSCRRRRQFVRRRKCGGAAYDESESGQGAHGRCLVQAEGRRDCSPRIRSRLCAFPALR